MPLLSRPFSRRVLSRVALVSLGAIIGATGAVTATDKTWATAVQPCTAQFPAVAPSQVEGVYQVSEPGHLSWILQGTLVGKATVFSNLTADYRQAANIDLDNCLWTPLDGLAVAAVPPNKETREPGSDAVYGFTGSYDGGGFTISGLTLAVDQLPSETMLEGDSNDYELFSQVGFIGFLNGGSVTNLTLNSPRMSFALSEVASSRAELTQLGFIVGRAESATLRDLTVTEGTISLRCETDRLEVSRCAISGLGGVVGDHQEGASNLESVRASLSIDVVAPDAPVPQNQEDPKILSLQPSGISLSSAGGILGADVAGSTLTDLRVELTVTSDFPRLSQLGGIAGMLSGSRLLRASSASEMSFTTPGIFPGSDTSGGLLRIGGLVGSLDSDATVSLSRATGNITGDLEVLHLSDNPDDASNTGCRTQEGDLLTGTRATTWEHSDRFACRPIQALAEIGGLVGVILDPSTAGPSISSSFTRTAIALTVRKSPTVPNPLPEVVVESVGGVVGSVFPDENTPNHTVLQTAYSAGGVSVELSDSLSFGTADDVFGVFASRGSRGLVAPASMVGFWDPDIHSTAADVLWDQGLNPTLPLRGGSGKTTAEMTSATVFTAANWPLVNGFAPFEAGQSEWGICSGVNGGYPFLLWEYSSDPCATETSSPGNPASPSDSTTAAPLAPDTTDVSSPRFFVTESLPPDIPKGTEVSEGPEVTDDVAADSSPGLVDADDAPIEESSGFSAWLVGLGVVGVLGVAAAVAVAWALGGSAGTSSGAAGQTWRRAFRR